MPHYNEYQKSISQELLSIENRVRNFIDDRHWGEDGRYKEVILREIIEARLPDFAGCGTGFVIGRDGDISTQIDIIIYRKDIPILFKKKDFVIVTQEAVLGIIEVKTKLYSTNIMDTIEKAHRNGELIDHYIFNGIFSYENYTLERMKLDGRLKETLLHNFGQVNNISFGPDFFLKYWPAGAPRYEPSNKYRLYKIEDLSFGYFISNLIEDVYLSAGGNSLSDNMRRVFFSIEKTKEAYQVETLTLDNQ